MDGLSNPLSCMKQDLRGITIISDSIIKCLHHRPISTDETCAGSIQLIIKIPHRDAQLFRWRFAGPAMRSLLIHSTRARIVDVMRAMTDRITIGAAQAFSIQASAMARYRPCKLDRRAWPCRRLPTGRNVTYVERQRPAMNHI